MKDLNVSLLSLLEMEKDLLNDIAFNNESASEFEKVGNLKIAKNYKDEKIYIHNIGCGHFPDILR